MDYLLKEQFNFIIEIDKLKTIERKMFGMLPLDQEKELSDLWFEFEKKETNEAKFATSLDRLQPLIHNHLNGGDTWRKYNITSDQVVKRNKEIKNGSEKLWEYAQLLIEKSVEQGILSK